MAFNCFARIFGAGWNKTAGRRQPRRDYCFVKLQKRNQNKTHRLMWHRLQSVSCPAATQTKVCATLSAALVPRHLLNNPTKLTKAKFFVRTEQRSFGVDDPVVLLPERVQLTPAASKNFPQQTPRAVAIDRLSYRFRRGRHTQSVYR